MDAPPSFPKYFKKTTLFWLILPMLLFIGFIVYFEIELPPSLLALRGIFGFQFFNMASIHQHRTILGRLLCEYCVGFNTRGIIYLL